MCCEALHDGVEKNEFLTIQTVEIGIKRRVSHEAVCEWPKGTVGANLLGNFSDFTAWKASFVNGQSNHLVYMRGAMKPWHSGTISSWKMII
jgi:hypothetical protein